MNEITSQEAIKDLKSLGNKNTEYYNTPSIDILETFPSPSDKFYTVEFVQAHNEFTSLCPKTSQPDFATFKIYYSPNEVCVESKSLKQYLFSYRDSKGFGEAITNQIADDLDKKISPNWILVVGEFSPRGGISWTTRALRTLLPLSELSSLSESLIVNYK